MAISNETIAANANKFIKVNSGGTDVEYAAGSGGASWGSISGTLDGWYALVCVTSATMATSSHTHITCELQMRNA